MRTTMDIPDPVYRELKSDAALKGRSVKELILLRVTSPAREAAATRRKIGSLKLGPEGIYEYIPFP